MILDAQEQLVASQAITASAVGTNVKDLTTDRSIGSGEPMCVIFNVEVAADSTTGDEKYTFDVETCSDAAQTTARRLLGRCVFESGTPTAPAEAVTLLAAGIRFIIPIPPILLSETERYLGVRCTAAGTTPTITYSAWLQPVTMAQLQFPAVYPKGAVYTHA